MPGRLAAPHSAGDLQHCAHLGLLRTNLSSRARAMSAVEAQTRASKTQAGDGRDSRDARGGNEGVENDSHDGKGMALATQSLAFRGLWRLDVLGSGA